MMQKGDLITFDHNITNMFSGPKAMSVKNF